MLQKHKFSLTRNPMTFPWLFTWSLSDFFEFPNVSRFQDFPEKRINPEYVRSANEPIIMRLAVADVD